MNKNAYKAHWENVFLNKDTSKVSWYQEKPITSLELIEKYAESHAAAIIDVGGGDSRLPDNLVDLKYENLTVIDISHQALDFSKKRMGLAGEKVKWLASNILEFESKEAFALWHDRAVFHFISDPEQQVEYKNRVVASMAKDGILILATFSKNEGPLKCSGLEIEQHDRESIEKLFNPEFKLMEAFEQVHVTPSGGQQNFNWVVLKKKN